jgi:LPXTG-motif cell wall-anchored protein
LFVLNIEGQPFPVVWAILGAAILSALLSLFFRRRRVYYR